MSVDRYSGALVAGLLKRRLEGDLSMRAYASVVLFSLLLLSPSAAPAQERGHAAFVFGWTFGEQNGSLYGAQFGAGVGRGFSIVGGIESLQDVLTGRYALFLYDVASLPGVDLTAEIPGLYYGGGLRWSVPGAGISPFAQVEMGATTVSPEIAFTVGGQDVTDQILAPGELDETAFTFVLGGGLRGNIGDSFLVEVAFKFFDIMTEQELSLNKLSFAIGARF
jgi:hypothetical protein